VNGITTAAEVSGNRIAAAAMSAILFAPDYSWLEAGSSSDLKFTGHSVKKCPAPGDVGCSASGLRVENSPLELNSTRKSVPGWLRQAGLTELQPVMEVHCSR
jgi:hypothetical protein